MLIKVNYLVSRFTLKYSVLQNPKQINFKKTKFTHSLHCVKNYKFNYKLIFMSIQKYQIKITINNMTFTVKI